mgnify:CR=1 FL=1
MNKDVKNKLVLFGCPLDCDEKHDSILEKHQRGWPADLPADPLLPVAAILEDEAPEGGWENLGSVPVPSWLSPLPGPDGIDRVVVDEFVAFLDAGGCLNKAEELAELTASRIRPDIPCLVAVDHSMAGGPLKALSSELGPEEISLVVLDAHTDAIPMAAMGSAIAWDIKTNPATVYDPEDPFIRNRADSYNASSFIHHLLEGEVIYPENLYLLGVTDFPDKKALRIKDPLLKEYISAFTSLRKRGGTVITKKDLSAGSGKARAALSRIDTPYVYVSVDLDVGAGKALSGVRFTDRYGISAGQMYSLARALRALLGRGVELIGMDVSEFNPRRAGTVIEGRVDPTYRIAADFIKIIGLGLSPERPLI